MTVDSKNAILLRNSLSSSSINRYKTIGVPLWYDCYVLCGMRVWNLFLHINVLHVIIIMLLVAVQLNADLQCLVESYLGFECFFFNERFSFRSFVPFLFITSKTWYLWSYILFIVVQKDNCVKYSHNSIIRKTSKRAFSSLSSWMWQFKFKSWRKNVTFRMFQVHSGKLDTNSTTTNKIGKYFLHFNYMKCL